MTVYREQTGYFEADDAIRLFYNCSMPENGSHRFDIVIHHGIGEHSGRYRDLIEWFSGSGINFYNFDARGHGRSEGTRGCGTGVERLAKDLSGFLQLIRKEFGVERPVLLGHSLGGLVVLHYALRHSQESISAVIASAPALLVPLTLMQRLKLIPGRLLARGLPEFTMPTGLSVKNLSRDEEVVRAYISDPLVHDRTSAGLAVDVIEDGKRLIRLAPSLKIPLLLMHGAQDRITDPSGSKMFFELAGSSTKTLKIYPGLYHEIFNEKHEDREIVLKDLRDWIISNSLTP